MAPLKFIPFVFAFSLFSRSSHAAKAGQPADTASVAETAPVNCLNAFNAPRTLAGLPLFIEKSTMTGHRVESLCDRVQQGTGGFYEAGTFFYAHQTGEEQDCAAAVAYWRGGLAAVKNQLPPAYTKDSDIYKNEQFLGLVGLFNPKENAAVECQYVKCPVTATTTQAPPAGSTTDSTTEASPTVPSGPDESQTGDQPAGGNDAEGVGKTRSAESPQATPASAAAPTGVPAGIEAKAGAPTTSGAPAGTPDAVTASSSAASAPSEVSKLEVKSETGQEGAAAGSAAPSASGVSAEAKQEPSDASLPLTGNARRLEAAKSTYNALVCMTTPAVLVEKQQPFTQGQWEKILGATSASTAATVPVFSLLALTALAIYMN